MQYVKPANSPGVMTDIGVAVFVKPCMILALLLVGHPGSAENEVMQTLLVHPSCCALVTLKAVSGPASGKPSQRSLQQARPEGQTATLAMW